MTEHLPALPGLSWAQDAALPALPGLPVPTLPGMPPAVPVPLPSGWIGGYWTIADQISLFAGCVYIEILKRILCPDGVLRDEKEFNVWYGGREFQMTPDGSRPTTKAWDAFTQNRAHNFPKVRGPIYSPNHPFGTIVGDAVNALWFAPGARVAGDPGPYLDLVLRVLPDPNDQAIFLTWCAAMVQHPGVKFQWGIGLQGTEGNGKTFLAKSLTYAVGIDMVHLPNSQDMGEKFNQYMEGKLLIVVEEIHMDGRRNVMDRLKPFITNDRIEIRAMHTNKYMTDNLTNWMFLTNYRDAIIKSQNDRRIAVFFTAQQEAADLIRDGMDGDYFPRLWNWANNGGWAIIADYLSRVPLDPRFNPCGLCQRAPKTSTSEEAIAESHGAIETEILDAIESDAQGFRGGWLSSIILRRYIESNLGKSFSLQVLNRAIHSIGFVEWGRAPRSFAFETGRPKLYCRPEMKGFPFDHYIMSQGYLPLPQRGTR